MNILASLKSKALGIFCVVLITALSISYLSGKSNYEQLTALQIKYSDQLSSNQRLSEQNLALVSELESRPAQLIEVVREVQVEICNGKIQQELINSLPKKGVVNDKHEGITADIDDRLPDDLLRLLK